MNCIYTNEIPAKINDIKLKIKELYKCKEITKRAEGIQSNFDKDSQKEKDNSRSLRLKLSF